MGFDYTQMILFTVDPYFHVVQPSVYSAVQGGYNTLVCERLEL